MNRVARSAALVLLSIASAVQAQSSGIDIARRYRQAHEAEILSDFARLLAMPNLASDSVNIRANANYLADALRALGLKAELWSAPGGAPAVYGELIVPGATRTLGIYAHYDGQPTGDLSTWANPPWQPTLYTKAIEAGGQRIPMPKAGERVDPEWRLYARSAGDDKAPIIALLTTLKALREAGVKPTANLRILLDGEEEADSEHLDDYLEQHRALLSDIDTWLFFDGPVHQSRRPQVVFGVRGVVGMELTVYGATRSLHSGHYGNWAPNPAQMLASLLASMKDDDGRVLVAGFYDSAAPIGEQERRALAAMPDYDTQLRRELGLVRTEGKGESLPQRLLLPSLNIRGFASGNVGANARNVIPNTAAASLDIRLVQGNDPGHMVSLVEEHVRAQGYHVVRSDPDMETRLRYPKIVKITRDGGYPAARTPMSVPLLAEIVAAARSVAGDQLLLVPTLGGSLPLHLFTDRLRKPALVMPIANHDNNQHAADENLRVANLWYGIDLLGALFTIPARPRS
jgi:acetylornithine deacetylase/succinyl-diaminopimelate desuccinylase-like protein